MALVLKVAAAVIAVAGLATLWRGTDPSLLTYGYTLMTVGAVFAGAGIVLFGLGEVAGRLEALRAALAGEAPGMASGRPASLAEPPVEATEPAPAPVPPTRESLGLRPLGAGAAAAVAATGLAASAAAAPASAAVPDEPAVPEPAAEPDPAIDALLADIRDAAGDTPAQPAASVPAADGPAAATDGPSAPAEEPPLLVAGAVPVIGELKSDPAQAAQAEPAEPDPLASLSQALEDLTDEIARGGRAEPLPASEPVPVPPPLPAAEPLAATPEPAPVVPERDPEQELADLIAAESGAIRSDRDPAAAGGEELVAEPVQPAEPDSFLARLRRSMGGGDRKEIQKPREEPVLPVVAAAAPALPEAGAVEERQTPAAETETAAAVVSPEPVDEPAAEPAELPAFSIEAEMERALLASLDAKPAVEQAAPPAAAPVVPPPVVAPAVVAPAAAPEPAPTPVVEPRGASVRDPAMATLARDFPELGDLLAPRKPSPADPADALIADLKGIFDGSEPAPSRTEPAFQPAAAPPPRPVAPLLREGVIAQIPFRLYGDGTIEADLPEGTTHFGSLREFRAHVGG